MIAGISIEIIKNLAQYDYNNQYYDLHNDYSCEKISSYDGILLIHFKNFEDGSSLSLKFTDIKINNLYFFNVKETESLTLDLLYRGRIEMNGDLIEVSEDGRVYFYLEFYEGQKIEFWAKYLCIEKL